MLYNYYGDLYSDTTQCLQDLGTFLNVHRFTLNLHGLKIMIVESFPSNITNWDCVVIEKWVKQVTKLF